MHVLQFHFIHVCFDCGVIEEAALQMIPSLHFCYGIGARGCYLESCVEMGLRLIWVGTGVGTGGEARWWGWGALEWA